MPRKWKKLYETGVAVVCPYCLKPIEKGQYSIEHEPPQSRQNEFGPSKTIWACKKCNHQKGALTASEYAEWKRLEFIRNGGLTNKGRQR